MKQNKTIITCLAAVIGLAFVFAQPAEARRQKKADKAKSEAAAKDSANASKRPYAKVFKKKDKLTQVQQKELSLFLYENKVYVEFPVRNFGREYLLSSSILEANIPLMVGRQVNDQMIFTVHRADTLLTFSRPKANYRISEGDMTTAKAFELSGANAIFRTASIEAWNNDSTAVLVELTDFLSSSNKEVFDPDGIPYDIGMTIKECAVKSQLSYLIGVKAFRRCVCLEQSVTGSLSLAGTLIGELSEKPSFQGTLQTLITLLPADNDRMMPREAHAAVGTRFVAYNDYRDLERTKTGYYATRRKFTPGDVITFYVDSLISPSWTEAVRRAAEGWNDSFEKAGLGRPLQLVPFPKDSTFSAADPLENVILFANSNSQSVSLSLPTDPRTGEILSTHIYVPRNLVEDVRRYGICKMAETDERYRCHDLPDDLLAEILQAKMLTAFGHSLGLSTNLAGSAAYTPEQLRSPEFTQKYGITASVMDGQIYNYVAMPGDKEKGVALTFNHPGVYDDFVVKYLYTPDVSDDTLKQWVKSHAGDARYFYGRRSLRYATDPRSQSFDMSSDPLQAARNMMQHYRYLAKHAPEWTNYSELPDTYRELFPEFVINDYFSLLQTVTAFIGGVYFDEYVGQDCEQTPLTRAVPRKKQREAVRMLFNELSEVSWLDSNPMFFGSAGPSADVGGWIRRKCYAVQLSMAYKLPYMDMSVLHADKPYTQGDLIDDIIDCCFRPVKVGRKPSAEELQEMHALVTYLINESEMLASINKAKLNHGEAQLSATAEEPVCGVTGSPDETMGMGAVTEINYFPKTDLTPILLEKLQKVRPLLVKAKSLLPSQTDKYKVDYTIKAIDRVTKD